MTPETAILQNLQEDPPTTPVQYRTGEKEPIGFIKKPGSNSAVSPAVLKAYIQTAYKGENQPGTLLGRRAISDKIRNNFV